MSLLNSPRKVTNKCNALFFLVILALCISCDDEDSGHIKKDGISGSVQKGPFVSGSNIVLNELRQDLSQTGKSFTAQIFGYDGTFEMGGVELESPYAFLRADGFYFNEVSGKQSSAPITLYALSDVTDRSNVQVNVLTHLERARVENLVSQGISFEESKIQAQHEVMQIFNIDLESTLASEDLDIAKPGDENAALLAISVILQGYRSEGKLTELMASIINDIKTDGILNDETTGSNLIDHAILLDTTTIRANIQKKYADLGISAEIPPFEKFVKNFINETNFTIKNSLISFPEEGAYGPNIFSWDEADTVFQSTSSEISYYSGTAKLGEGAQLKIVCTNVYASADLISHIMVNWEASIISSDLPVQYLLESIESNKVCDIELRGKHHYYNPPYPEYFDNVFILEYYPMGWTTPYKTQKVRLKKPL